ncbi:MAG: class I SAM-dependent methyltransferase [Elusimicrobiaceae bacterium]
MKNAREYYRNMTGREYARPTLMRLLFSKSADRTIIPILRNYSNLRVLELGCGAGRFTKEICLKNIVKCVDVNPHLFTLDGIPVVKGDCRQLSACLGAAEKFDRILSFFMTEYLTFEENRELVRECRSYLKPDGELVFTFVNGFWGSLYVWGSRLVKGTGKHTCGLGAVRAIADYSGFDIAEVREIGRFGFRMSALVRMTPKT